MTKSPCVVWRLTRKTGGADCFQNVPAGSRSAGDDAIAAAQKIKALVGYFNCGSLIGVHLGCAALNLASELHEIRRILQADGLSAIAARTNVRVQREFAEKMNIHHLGGLAAAAVAEYVHPLIAVRANQVAHVFDHSKNRHAHLLEHV